jgi:hypothetical protein
LQSRHSTLEPHHQSILLWLFWRWGSPALFARAGLKPRSSRAQSPEYLKFLNVPTRVSSSWLPPASLLLALWPRASSQTPPRECAPNHLTLAGRGMRRGGGGARRRPRPPAQPQGTGGAAVPMATDQQVSPAVSAGRASPRPPIAMCAAEVDRHIAQRYRLKRRLGKGVSAEAPRGPRSPLGSGPSDMHG